MAIIASGTWWRLEDDGTLYVYCTGKMPSGEWDNYTSSITAVDIASGVTSTSYAAFKNCTSLTDITIPSSVTSIGNNTFSGCASLTSITIPSSVTLIGTSAFDSCATLGGIHVASSNRQYSSDDGVLFNKNKNSLLAYPAGKSGTAYVVPSSVTSIGSYAFYGCANLTSVTIPDGVTSIKSYAFRSCSGLTSVTIPSSVTSIGNGAFYDCSGLTGITIQSGVTSIGQNAFFNCTSLTSITIPSSVTSIGVDATFYGCTSLTSITIPSSVTSIGNRTFYDCSALTSVTIPQGVTSIGNGAFLGCTRLSDVYYGGTAAQWNAITIGSSNTPLTRAAIHCNYTPIVTCTVTFDANGGTGTMSAQTFDAGTAQALTPNAFTRTGYTFGGWNTAADGSGTNYVDGVSYTASADVTLYAQWAAAILTSIAVTNPPTKTAYTEWDVFDPSGMVVTAAYSDGTTAAVSGYSVSPSGALTVADTVITVTYTGDGVTATATVAITVTVQSFSTNWPRTARDVMREIAYRIDAPLDPRTAAVLGTDEIEDTALTMSMREVAGYIAAMYGGNWTVTDEGYLYLVPLAMAARVLGDENGVPILFEEALLLV